MRERSLLLSRPAVRALSTSIDVVMLTPREQTLAVLLLRSNDPRARDRWMLPWDAPRQDEPTEHSAQRIARAALGDSPAALEQIAAFGDGRRHPSDAQLSVAFVGLVPLAQVMNAPDGVAWVAMDQMPLLAPRHRAMVEGAVDAIRRRMDQSPLAFRLLPSAFTLSELQSIYELLLGRALHKASFRRALQAAMLVEPTDEWKSEGRGRPAQLYRYAPRKKRGSRRGVRFDLID